MDEQYSFDMSLDFLDSSTSNAQQNTTTIAAYQQGEELQTFDIESLATRIASVDDLVVQLKMAKDEHSKLQKQMQDLSDSAMSIRSMYEREKIEKAKYALLAKELQEKYDQVESQLTNKTLHFEQLSSKLEQSAEKGPISYNDLALRYQRLALQMDEEKLLHNKEKIYLQQMQDYIESKKLTPLPALKKKHHLKKEVDEYALQRLLKAETKSEGTQVDLSPPPKEMCSQGTQYTWYTTTRGTNTPAFKELKDVRTQGTQYISSTTTRGTSTSTFIKKHSIGTNFPEVVPVSIEDIFKEMICDVSPLSPMTDDPEVENEVSRIEKVEMKSVSTNTELKNVRKPLDYVTPSIKHSDSRPPSRNMYDRVKNESPFMGMPMMNPFAGLGISTPPMHNTVAELWNMLGHTIFALLQNSSAPLNPMHTNVVNERMRNLNADINRRREQQREERSNYFDERQDSPRDYLPATRSTATSPITTAELEGSDDYLTGGTQFVDRIYQNPSPFVAVPIQEENSRIQAPIEIQKILLNRSPQTELLKEKTSRVDDILKLFPEYSHSLQKRKAIKRLLRTSNTEKKSKKKAPQVDSSVSRPFQRVVPHRYTDEESMLSDSRSESPTMGHARAGTNEEEDSKPSSSRGLLACKWTSADDGFRGFDESSRSSDEVFCKPFLPPIRNETVVVSSPFELHEEKSNQQLHAGGGTPGVCFAKKQASNCKRKRRASKSDVKRVEKVYKVDVPDQVTQKLHQEGKYQMTANLNRLPAQSQDLNPNSVLYCQEASNFNKLSNVSITTATGGKERDGLSTRVPKPSASVQWTLNENIADSVIESQKQKKLANSEFLFSDLQVVKADKHLNTVYLQSTSNKEEATSLPQSHNELLNFNVPGPKNCPQFTASRHEKPSSPLVHGQETLNFNVEPDMSEKRASNVVPPNEFPAAKQETVVPTDSVVHDHETLNVNGKSSTRRKKSSNVVIQDQMLLTRNGFSVPIQEIAMLGDKRASNLICDELNPILHDHETLDFNGASNTCQKNSSKVVIQDQMLLNPNKFSAFKQEISASRSLNLEEEDPANPVIHDQELRNLNGEPDTSQKKKHPKFVIQDQRLLTMDEEKPLNSVSINQELSCSELLTSEQKKSLVSAELDQNPFNPHALTAVNESSAVSRPEMEPSKHQRLTADSPKNEIPPIKLHSETELSDDCPSSPGSHDTSPLDLSSLLKTPEKDHHMPQFKTPDSCNRNSFRMTSSTEDFVEGFLNEDAGKDEPKFQMFLDKILEEVRPPLSPISIMAPTEKTPNSGTESSCDDVTSKPQTIRQRKRKPPATAAIAVKRSARLRAKNSEETRTVNTASLSDIAGIQLGKYTKRRTEPLKKPKDVMKQVEEVKKENKVEIACDIKMGFFRELLEEENDLDSSTEQLVIDESPEANKLKGEVLKETEPIQKQLDNVTTSIEETTELYQNLPAMDSYQNKWQETRLEMESPSKEFSQANNLEVDIKADEDQLSNIPPLSFDECPASPNMVDQEPEKEHITRELAEFKPATPTPVNNSMLSYIIANYNLQQYKMLTKVQKLDEKLLSQLESIINSFISGLCLVMDCVRAVDTIVSLTTSEKLIAQALIEIVKTAPRPETEVPPPVPELYLGQTICKLLSLLDALYHQLPGFRKILQITIEHSLFSLTKDITPLEHVMNLTQFYLATIADSTATTNPARLFICKCLYFYNQKATPMIYETLCVYPSVLPKREDTTYDRSDALISTIQCILMSTFYDIEKSDMKTRQILTKLRKFYNYESFKPPQDEVLENLMAKIRAGRLKNVSYAFALICKRMEQRNAEKVVLGDRLLPLANEYYHSVRQTTENDEKIACLLECISFIIKPFDLDTDISTYINLFGRFLNTSDRRIIQEAALVALLRTIRFGYVNCFNAIYNFKPNYELADTTKVMLRSFVYKKNLDFLKKLEHQARVLVAT